MKNPDNWKPLNGSNTLTQKLQLRMKKIMLGYSTSAKYSIAKINKQANLFFLH